MKLKGQEQSKTGNSRDTELQNMAMAIRVSQLMIQQLTNNLSGMSQDMARMLNQLYELQYKFTALVKHLNIDVAALNSTVEGMRLRDFEEAAAREDEKEGLIEAEAATPDSTVVITSVAKNEQGDDVGIFRSRIKLSESGSPELIQKLTGKRVGEKVTVKLNNIDHEIELLSIKVPREKKDSSDSAASSPAEGQLTH